MRWVSFSLLSGGIEPLLYITGFVSDALSHFFLLGGVAKYDILAQSPAASLECFVKREKTQQVHIQPLFFILTFQFWRGATFLLEKTPLQRVELRVIAPDANVR